MLVRLEERVTVLERDMGRHEIALEKDLRRAEANSQQLTRRTDDQERRLARTETALEGLRNDTAEIKQDVKTLLTNPKK